MRYSGKKAGNLMGPKTGRQTWQVNDEMGPVFTGGWVNPSSAVTDRLNIG
jgi:hypothetical protein